MAKRAGRCGQAGPRDAAEGLRHLLARFPELIELAEAAGLMATRDLLVDAERAAQRRLRGAAPARLH